jgi:hypothetical protein
MIVLWGVQGLVVVATLYGCEKGVFIEFEELMVLLSSNVLDGLHP